MKHRIRIKSTAGYLVCMLATLVGCSTRLPSAALSDATVKIAFSSSLALQSNDAASTILVMDSDGSHVAQFARGRNAVPGPAPSWSPDGKCLSFETYFAIMSSGLTIFCEDGRELQILKAAYGAWSPDGKSFAYHRLDYEDVPGPARIHSSLHVLRFSTGVDLTVATDIREVSTETTGMRMSWSLKGNEIVYEARYAGSPSGLYIINSDGSSRRFLTSGDQPSWSPTRMEIAYRDQGVLWLINLADGQRQRIEPGSNGNDRWPSWSPDGNELVFESNRDGHTQIYRIHRDGTGLRRLTHSSALDSRPAWRP